MPRPARATITHGGESPTLRLARLLAQMETVRTRRRLGDGSPAGDENFGLFHLIAFAFGLPVKTRTIEVFPWLTSGFLVLLALAFAGQLLLPERVPDLVVRPSEVATRPWTLLTAMFVHADLFHLLGNAYVLHLFGGDVEARLGRARFGALYLLAGILAGVAWVAANAGSNAGAAGASGAISGVIGAYVPLAGGQKILFRVRHLSGVVPDYLFIGAWVVFQALSLAASVPGVGWIAHLGGFATGLVLAGVWRRAIPN